MTPLPSKRLPNAQKSAFALIFALTMLVLMAGLTVAYFSRASSHRKVGSSSVSSEKAKVFARTATNFVVKDLLAEIEAGSEPDSISGEGAVRRPLRAAVATGTSYAPSVAPQRVGNKGSGGVGIANIVKKSKNGEPFFTQGDGYQTPAPGVAGPSNRASAISTGSKSLNGRTVALDRWNKPALMTTAEMATFTAPDWIYVDRAGKTPTSFTTETLKAMANRAVTNQDFVVGRFAYVVYDEGGLLDVNVAGNALAANVNARRGRLHQVNPDAIGPVQLPKFSDFVSWRSPVTKSKGGDATGELFDPTNDFRGVAAGDQSFVNRQDLIRYAQKSGSNGPIPPDALPYLTTFSRDLNAPSFAPDPNRPTPPSIPIPTGLDSSYEMNPALLSVRFPSDGTLQRPGEDAINVKAGMPVMLRRFPLNKLSLIADGSLDADAIRYYFGLERQTDGSWLYVKAKDGRIARLKEIAQELPMREPNFFEILQAVIYNGSLARHAGVPIGTSDDLDNTATTSYLTDSLANRHVLQIGANLIDQWDGDDFPTTLSYPSATSGDPMKIYGVENLPYLHQISTVPIRPKYRRDWFELWALFTMWNPHQNAAVPPNVEGLRILPVGGSSRTTLAYAFKISPTGNDSTLTNKGPEVGTNYGAPFTSFVDLNQGNALSVPVAGYSEPTVIAGEEPAALSDQPGLLLSRYNLNEAAKVTTPAQARPNPAIPPKDQMHPDLQGTLNRLMDDWFPYEATQSSTGTNANGNRTYPSGTTFSGKEFDTHWGKIPDPEVPGTEIEVYAKMGVKAHNWARHDPNPNDPLALELQASIGGKWVTYQRIEGWHAPSDSMSDGTQDSTNMPGDTHHSKSSDLSSCFYRWRAPTSVANALQKIDPRSIRFGLSTIPSQNYLEAPPQGWPLRGSFDAWNGNWTTNITKSKKWMLLAGKRVIGTNAATNGLLTGFERMGTRTMPFGFIANNPFALDWNYPMRYADLDGLVRPADGYWGAQPTIPVTDLPAPVSLPGTGRMEDRPVILNRPFRTVGEMGFVFRDVPFKSIDFATQRSGDLGLLDVFSLEETKGETPLVAGKVNLNTQRKEVLAMILKGTEKRSGDINSSVSQTTLSAADADTIAERIVQESALRPFATPGEAVQRILGLLNPTPATLNPIPTTEIRKGEREAAIRTLAGLGTTTTWNLLIDVIAQTGRFAASSQSGADFQVEGERRVWLHVAIDRRTGKVVEVQKEEVYE